MRLLQALLAVLSVNVLFALDAASAISIGKASPIHTLQRRAQFLPNHQPATLRPPTFPTNPDSTNFCSPEQKAMITKHLDYALHVVEHVVDNLGTSPSSKAYLTYMDVQGPSNPERFKNVMNIFRSIKADLTGPEGPKGGLQAKCGQSATCRETKAIAHADPIGHGINFCDVFFEKASLVGWLSGFIWKNKPIPLFENFKCKNEAGKMVFDFKTAGFEPNEVEPLYGMSVHTLIHEMAHLYRYPGAPSAIDNCYYGAYAAEYMGAALSTAATANADNYAWFAVSNYILTLCDVHESSQLLRDVGNTHYPTFKEAWEEFNAAKNTYTTLKKELAGVEADYSTASKKLVEMEVDAAMKAGGPTKEDTDAIAQGRKVKSELDAKRVSIDGQIAALGPGRINDYTVDVCETHKTEWKEIETVIAGVR